MPSNDATALGVVNPNFAHASLMACIPACAVALLMSLAYFGSQVPGTTSGLFADSCTPVAGLSLTPLFDLLCKLASVAEGTNCLGLTLSCCGHGSCVGTRCMILVIGSALKKLPLAQPASVFLFGNENSDNLGGVSALTATSAAAAAGPFMCICAADS